MKKETKNENIQFHLSYFYIVFDIVISLTCVALPCEALFLQIISTFSPFPTPIISNNIDMIWNFPQVLEVRTQK